MTAPLSKDEVSVVLIGSFNPTIFHPSWLALNNLISREQADNAAITRIVYAEVTQFSAAYMSFEVLPQRFTVRCEGIYGDAVRDLVLKAFGEILPHTPVRQMGINRSYEVKCTSESARSQLGMKLAPLGPWGAWGEEIAKAMSGSIHGGMTRIQMLQLPRPDGLDGHIQADVHPNLTDRTGVFLEPVR